MPRFEIEGDHLKLIPSPYRSSKDFYKDNEQGPSAAFKAHVRAHDRFCFLDRYEVFPILRDSVLLKLIALISRFKVNRDFWDPGSEAVRVSKKIFEEMDKEAQRSGAEFVLLFIPSVSDIAKYRRSQDYRHKWEGVVSAVTENVKYIDLMQTFKDAPASDLDTAYDGAHCGPRMNRLIADYITKELGRLHVVESR
jgi:hypothetical protein